eukprot:6213730-Pleurochrysis_carterae.AAC.2
MPHSSCSPVIERCSRSLFVLLAPSPFFELLRSSTDSFFSLAVPFAVSKAARAVDSSSPQKQRLQFCSASRSNSTPYAPALCTFACFGCRPDR